MRTIKITIYIQCPLNEYFSAGKVLFVIIHQMWLDKVRTEASVFARSNSFQNPVSSPASHQIIHKKLGASFCHNAVLKLRWS